MANSRKSDTAPYLVGGAILLFGALSATSVLVAPSSGGKPASNAQPVQAKAAVKAASVPSAPASAPATPASGPASAPLPPASIPASAPPLQAAAVASVPSAPVMAASTAAVAAAPATPIVAVKPEPVAHKALEAIRSALKPAKAEQPMKPARVERQAMPTMPAIPTGMPVAPSLPLPAPGQVQATGPEGPKAFTAPPTAARKEVPGPADRPTKPPTTSTGPALVTASGNKAWIRLDERRTVAVEKGQSLEGYGAFLGVEKGVAKFERGSVASKVEATDASARN